MSGAAHWLRLSEPGNRIFCRADVLTAHWVFARNYEYRKRKRRIQCIVSKWGWALAPFEGRHHLGPNGQDIYDDIVAKWARRECKGRRWQ